MANKIKNIKLGNVKYDIYDNTALHQGDAVGSVSSVVGQTGDVTVASIATALATAGYKLTDTDTNTWQAANSSQVGYVPASTANKILRADNTGALYWGDDSNTTYTLVGLMGSTAKGGATQPIYWDGSAFQNTTYTLGKSVPSDAVFTDTNTWRGIQDNLTSSTNTTESLSAKQGYLLANGSARDNTKLPLSGGTITGGVISVLSNGIVALDGTKVPVNNLIIGKNGIGISATDTNNDCGMIFMENSSSETNSLIIATGDDDGADKIKFRYYNTSGTATYESVIPAKSGTLALTSDIPSSLPASDVYAWAKASTKPSYSYSEISGTPSSLPASDVYSWAKASTKPTYIMNEVANISVSAITSNTSSSCTITGSSNAGKSQTIIYTNSSGSDLTVTVPTTYSTPDGAAIELTCANGGYCEVNYLNVGGTIYARGL